MEGQTHRGEVALTQLAPEAVEADPTTQRDLFEPSLVMVEPVQDTLVGRPLVILTCGAEKSLGVIEGQIEIRSSKL